jgi:DNA-binding NtrC family response regulator
MQAGYSDVDAQRQKNVCVCVSKDIYQFLKWSLTQYSKDIHVIKIDDPGQISYIAASRKTDVLIVDYNTLNGHAGQDLQEIKESNPSLNILLIIPSAINKEEAMAIIKDRLVKGVIVLPFSAEVLCNYLGKLTSSANTCSPL